FGSVQTVAATNGGTITVVGTYGYMPPEQFGGRCVAASDLYSLGATLIFLITGLHPTELPQKDLQIQFRQTANFSEEFADWLEWMTEPSLSQRFKSTEEAITALENPLPRQKTTSLSKQKLDKPSGSKIKLYKDINYLEIVIPPQGFRLLEIALISLISPFAIGFGFSEFGSVYSQELSDTAYLMKHTVQCFGIVFILSIVAWALFKRTRIKISKTSVSYIHELIGIKWKLSQPKLIKNQYQYQSGLTHPNPEELRHQYAHLSLEEMEWLTQEISDYLDIPISRI
ncbi:MAG: serine/threonine protein kinase, partial [Cyanobacteria bacterium P01_C01_bin.38]